jgi:LacI family transcriptional regulator
MKQPRHPTIKDVAREAGVSTVTVSRVVNDSPQVQPETRVRVERAMRDLGYLPNLAARSLRTSLTHTVGFLVPDLTSYPNAAVAQAAERRLAESGYALLLASSDYRAERELRVLEVLRARRVDGIVLHVCDEGHPALRSALAALDVPLVVLDRDLGAGLDRADHVLTDHEGAMAEAVRYLALLGHRRVALLLSDLPIRPVRERRRAFEVAAEAAGLAAAERPVVHLSPAAAGPVPEVVSLLDAPAAPTALIAEGSRLLRAVVRAAKALGRRVPADLSVVGIDAEDTAAAATPEITCVVGDFGAIGRTAAELMLHRLAGRPAAGPQRVLLPSAVVLKGSCAPPPSLMPVRSRSSGPTERC